MTRKTERVRYQEPEHMVKDKRTKLLLVALACIALSFVICAQFIPSTDQSDATPTVLDTGQAGDSLLWQVWSDYTLRFEGSGDMYDHTLGWSDDWMLYKSSITSIEFSADMTSIGEFAFENFDNSALDTVTIPASITKIPGSAFKGCTNISQFQVSLNNPNIYVDEEFLVYSTNPSNKAVGQTVKLITYPLALTQDEVIIPDAVTQVEPYCFFGNTSLKIIQLTERVSIIGESAFEECSKLEIMALPEYVTKVDQKAFYDCINLKVLYCGKSATWFGRDSFTGSTDLVLIAFATTSEIQTDEEHTGNERIYGPDVAFKDEQWYKSCTVDYTVKAVADTPVSPVGFEGNSVYLKEKRSPVDGTQSFYGLVKVSWTNSDSQDRVADVQVGGHNVSKDDLASTNVGYYIDPGLTGKLVELIGSINYHIYAYVSDISHFSRSYLASSGVEYIYLPYGIQNTYPEQFDLTKFKKLYIPSTVTLGGVVSWQNDSLLEIRCAPSDQGEVRYATQDGLLLNAAKTTVYQAFAGYTGTIVIPETVTDVMNFAMYGVSAKQIIMENQSVNIMSGWGLLNTDVVYIPSTVAGGNSAGSANEMQTKVFISGKGLNTTNGYTLSNLEYPTYHASAELLSIGRNQGATGVFDGTGLYKLQEGEKWWCDGTSTYIEDPAQLTKGHFWIRSQAQPVVNSNDGIMWTVIDDILVVLFGTSDAIPDYADAASQPWHSYKDSISYIVIEEGIRQIGANAFSGFSMADRVVIPYGVEKVGRGAFEDTAIEYLFFPKTVTSIGYDPDDPSAAQTIPLKESTTLKYVSIQSNNSTGFNTSSGALYTGTELTFCPKGMQGTYEVKDDTVSIGKKAFQSTKLTHILLPDTLQTIGSAAFVGSTIIDLVIPDNVNILVPNTDVEETDYLYGKADAITDLRSLSDLTLGASLDELGATLYGCQQLQTLKINGVGTIDLLATNLGGISLYDGGNQPIDVDEDDPTVYKLTRAGFTYTTYEFVAANRVYGTDLFWGFNDQANYILITYKKTAEDLGGDMTQWTTISGDPITQPEDVPWYAKIQYATMLSLSEGITSIGNYAFASSKFVNVVIPSSVDKIDHHAFYQSRLVSIDLSASDTMVLGEYAFAGSNLETFDVGNASVIPQHCFDGCKLEGRFALEDVNVGQYAFSNIQTSWSVSFSGSSVIGESAFRDSTGLTSIDLAGVSSVGISSFENTGLVMVEIPDTVTSIQQRAFFDCTSLKGVTIGASVNEIAANAFTVDTSGDTPHTSSLITVLFAGVSGNVTTIDPVAFPEASDEESKWIIDGDVEQQFDKITTDGGQMVSRGTYYTLGNSGWKSIGTNVMATITGTILLIKGTDPDPALNVISNHNTATFSAYAIDFPKRGTISTFVNIAEWNGWQQNIPKVAWFHDVKTVNIKNVEVIPQNLFYNCTLENVVLDDKVKTIGNNAFFGTEYLKSITLPTTIETIGEGAFKQSGLTSVSIPNNVSSLGNEVFMESALGSSGGTVTIGSGITTIPVKAFSGCENLVSLDIPATITIIGDSAFEETTSMSSLYLHSAGIQSIGSRILYQSTDSQITPDIFVDSVNRGKLADTSNTPIISEQTLKTYLEGGDQDTAQIMLDISVTETIVPANIHSLDLNGKVLRNNSGNVLQTHDGLSFDDTTKTTPRYHSYIDPVWGDGLATSYTAVTLGGAFINGTDINGYKDDKTTSVAYNISRATLSVTTEREWDGNPIPDTVVSSVTLDGLDLTKDVNYVLDIPTDTDPGIYTVSVISINQEEFGSGISEDLSQSFHVTVKRTILITFIDGQTVIRKYVSSPEPLFMPSGNSADGKTFIGWYSSSGEEDPDEGALIAVANAYYVPADNITLYARYIDAFYTITFTETEHGSVTGTTSISKGLTGYIQATPDDGFVVDTITLAEGGSCQWFPISENVWMTVPSKDSEITVTFKPIGTASRMEVFAEKYESAGTKGLRVHVESSDGVDSVAAGKVSVYYTVSKLVDHDDDPSTPSIQVYSIKKNVPAADNIEAGSSERTVSLTTPLETGEALVSMYAVYSYTDSDDGGKTVTLSSGFVLADYERAV